MADFITTICLHFINNGAQICGHQWQGLQECKTVSTQYVSFFVTMTRWDWYILKMTTLVVEVAQYKIWDRQAGRRTDTGTKNIPPYNIQAQSSISL